MVNKVILLGRLGRDPDCRTTAGGAIVTNMTLATTRKWKNKQGEPQEETEWHKLVAWGRTAEIAAQYLTKGQQLYVEGRLQTQSWEDKNSGEKRYRTQVVVDNLQMLARPSGSGAESKSGGLQESDTGFDPAEEDDDIPF